MLCQVMLVCFRLSFVRLRLSYINQCPVYFSWCYFLVYVRWPSAVVSCTQSVSMCCLSVLKAWSPASLVRAGLSAPLVPSFYTSFPPPSPPHPHLLLVCVMWPCPNNGNIWLASKPCVFFFYFPCPCRLWTSLSSLSVQLSFMASRH